jgi:hypothetical protein
MNLITPKAAANQGHLFKHVEKGQKGLHMLSRVASISLLKLCICSHLKLQLDKGIKTKKGAKGQ